MGSEQDRFSSSAESRVLVVDESSLNEVLALPKEGKAEGVIVLLNDSASSNQDAPLWNPKGSGTMWEELQIPLQAVNGSDAARMIDLAHQNSLQAGASASHEK